MGDCFLEEGVRPGDFFLPEGDRGDFVLVEGDFVLVEGDRPGDFFLGEGEREGDFFLGVLVGDLFGGRPLAANLLGDLLRDFALAGEVFRGLATREGDFELERPLLVPSDVLEVFLGEAFIF